MSKFNYTREDFEGELRLAAEDILRDYNYPVTHFDRDLIEDQAKACMFGDEFESHSFDDAVSVTICDTIGHAMVEKIIASCNIEATLKYYHISYRKTEDNWYMITCPRCHQEYRL